MCPSSSLESSSAANAKEANERLLAGGRTVWNRYDLSSQEKLNAGEQNWADITKRVDYVLWDATYGVCPIADIASSKHDVLGLWDSIVLLAVLFMAMEMGSGDDMLCLVL